MNNPTKNELELAQRLKRIEDIVFTEDNIETAKQLSKGAVEAHVNLLEQFALWKTEQEEFQIDCKGNYDKLIMNIMNQLKKIENEIHKIKQKINEMIKIL